MRPLLLILMVVVLVSGCTDSRPPSEGPPGAAEAPIGQEAGNSTDALRSSVWGLWVNYTGADTPPPARLSVEGAPGVDITDCHSRPDNLTCRYTSVSLTATWDATNALSERITVLMLDGEERIGEAFGVSPLAFDVDPSRFLAERTYGIRIKPEYEAAVDLKVRIELHQSYLLVPRVEG